MGLTKSFKTALMVWLAAVALAFLAMPQAVMASELATNPEHPVALMELLAVFLGNEQAAQWLTVLGLVAWVLTQVRAWVPHEWVDKLPNWVVRLLEVLAGNYRQTRNARGKGVVSPEPMQSEYEKAETEYLRAKTEKLNAERIAEHGK